MMILDTQVAAQGPLFPDSPVQTGTAARRAGELPIGAGLPTPSRQFSAGLLTPPAPRPQVSHRRSLRLAWSCLLCVAACSAGGGCKSPLKPDIKGIFGPAGRDAQAAVQKASQEDPLEPIEGAADLEKARALYDAKDYTQALKALKKIKKAYKDKPVEEDAMFLIAECYFQMKKYPHAQDGYDELFKKYESTRYYDTATRRLFKIAQIWLDSPKPASEVEVARYSELDGMNKDVGHEPAPPSAFPLKPNLFDRSRPVFDTPGRAIQALQSVWLRDSTGPLADDALMMAGTHFLRKRDFQEADRYFAQVRMLYPQSEFVQTAYVVGAHAKLMTYQGARYDGQTLRDAANLTKSTIRMFPDLPQHDKLVDKLTTITQQAAERDWERVQYHMRRREKVAAALYCDMIIEAHPNSPFADKAREVLEKVRPEEADPAEANQPEAEPDETEPQLLPTPPQAPEGNGDADDGEPGRAKVSDGEPEAGGESGGKDSSGDDANVGNAPGRARVSDLPETPANNKPSR